MPAAEAPRFARLNERAPDFAAMNAEGIWQSWTNFRGPKGLLIVFADQRTGSCLKPLYGQASAFSDNGFGLLVIDLSGRKTVNSVEAAYGELPRKLALRFDPRGNIGRLYGVQRLPSVFLLDGDLVLRFVGHFHQAVMPLMLSAATAVARGQVPEVQTGTRKLPETAGSCNPRPLYWSEGMSQ